MAELKYTPVESIPGIVNRVRTTFQSHKSKPIEFRRQQLAKLYWGYVSSLKTISTIDNDF